VCPYFDGKLDRVQNRFHGVAREAHDKECERRNMVLPANLNLFDELLHQDWLAMDALLDLGIGALDAEIDAGAPGTGHDLDRGLIETVDSRLTFPLDLQPTPQNFFANLDHPRLLEREHRVAKQDVLNSEMPDQVFHLIDHVGRGPET